MPTNPFEPPQEGKAIRIALVLMFAFAVVVLLSSAYVTAYIQLGDYRDYRGEGVLDDAIERYYGRRGWCLTFFGPAAALESKWTGCPVSLTYHSAGPLSIDTVIEPTSIIELKAMDLAE